MKNTMISRTLALLLALVMALALNPVWAAAVGGVSVGGSETPSNSGSLPTPVTPAMPINPFSDVFGTDWFIDDVIYVYDKGIMSGTSTEPMLFSPGAPLTRAMIVTILWRLHMSGGSGDTPGGEARTPAGAGSGISPFGDVADGAWYADAVLWASENGIVEGYGGGLFGPEDNITRQDLAVILMRYMHYKEAVFPVPAIWVIFVDESEIADYAMNDIQTLFIIGVITGVDANADGLAIVNPRGSATRAQAAAMLHRFIGVIEMHS